MLSHGMAILSFSSSTTKETHNYYEHTTQSVDSLIIKDRKGDINGVIFHTDVYDSCCFISQVRIDTQDSLGERNVAKRRSIRDGAVACHVRPSEEFVAVGIDLPIGAYDAALEGQRHFGHVHYGIETQHRARFV